MTTTDNASSISTIETNVSSPSITNTSVPQCNKDNFFSDECNKFLLKKELAEQLDLEKNTQQHDFLYPTLNDKSFNIKIAEKKEFYDTKYEGPDFSKTIQEQSDLLANADYELAPHQAFVKSFMSFQTPYSSLLLYHGLGTGKTCSAIGVCEEMRDYMKQVGINKRIMIVASENVQDNFKLQLFDERKLKEVNGIWSMKGCIGNKLLKEVNPMNVPMSKEKIISQIKTLINHYYIFLGYVQFANYIIKTMNYDEEVRKQRENRQRHKDDQKSNTNIKGNSKTKIQMLKDVKIEFNARIIKRLRNEFNNRLIVIDEVHNIRKSEDNENKKVAINLEYLVKTAENMRFLLLSATPMYNSYKEIIWLLNLMNTNDRRGRIDVKDVFDKNGNFKKNGEELFIRKATGYVSFVKGENPYTFPYRVYPRQYEPEKTFPHIKYPEYQMNLKKIKYEDKRVTNKQILSLFLTTIGNCDHCGECQHCCYNYIINHLRNKQFSITTKHGAEYKMPSFANMESFGYTLLQTPLESLIISYPIPGLKDILDKLPPTKYSDELSPSFDEEMQQSKDHDDKDHEESPEPIDESDLQESDESDLQEKAHDDEDESQTHLNKNNSKNRVAFHIDPHQLTGKAGIERMMTFVDTKSPPIKGEYEYKQTTLRDYGKIFSRNEIGKYSSKIHSILNTIYNESTKQVSNGIILIYSQYIDSGLIPMALALEEMGFTRFGQTGIKPLFKQRPCEVVDARTMKPPTNKNDFMPARYSMITGDPRLSPNNDLEVKGLTNDDNKDGNKVKVVLISRAGSEGIDFRFIRQVHILDPWYNLNRIEQIIGRGVRNFSHKDLPFENRNVQIFLHGTILDKNLEEAADLYVYRIAEHKAKQIGKVTRLLKETSVDCIINHDQSLFTQQNMSANLKETITQTLSTGKVLKDFKVGDAPFSPTCDYMEDCNYQCRPNANIDQQQLNEDTYNESFIMVNGEKIIHRIRMLFREAFFYKKEALFHAIRRTKEYPYVQIYSALTQLIDDENEFIVDKYGRHGRLVNIGEYYLFQPLELTNQHVSLFDRSVPLDYKHSMVNFQLKHLSNKDKKRDQDVSEQLQLAQQQGVQFPEGKHLLEETIQPMFNTVKEYQEKGKVPRGDDNWFKHCGVVINKIVHDFPGIEPHLNHFVIAHIIETLLFQDKIHLMNYLYSLENIPTDSVASYAKSYFDRHVISTPHFIVYIAYNLDKRMIMQLDNSSWKEVTSMIDMNEIAKHKLVKQYIDIPMDEYNTTVGFLGYEKGNASLVFKTKNMQSKRDTGARCDEAGKAKNIAKLNQLLGEEKYNAAYAKTVGNIELCVFTEFVLRYFNETKHNGKYWFFTPEMAIYHKLYNILKTK